MSIRSISIILSFALVASACSTPYNCGRPVAGEKVIATSPDPDSIYLYTPAIVEGFGGRFVVAVDYGGPGTYSLDGPKSDFGDYKAGNQIRVLLSYSPDLLRWTFAGLVAVGPTDHSARHYATMVLDGDDLLIVSRSGDEKARTAHDGNIVTFHRVKDFRKLVY